MQPKLGGGDLFWKSGMHQNNGEKPQLMEINRAELNTACAATMLANIRRRWDMIESHVCNE